MEAAMMGATGAPTWQGIISGMYNWDDTDFGSLGTTNANRAGNKNADLLFCTTFVGDSLMSDNETIVDMRVDGKDASFSVPAFWAVPEDGKAAHWEVPDAN